MFARFGGVLSSVLFNNIPLVVKDLSKHGRLLTSDYPFVSIPSIDAPEALHIFPVCPTRVLIFSADWQQTLLGVASRSSVD
jgi:hypothetical protein